MEFSAIANYLMWMKLEAIRIVSCYMLESLQKGVMPHWPLRWEIWPRIKAILDMAAMVKTSNRSDGAAGDRCINSSVYKMPAREMRHVWTRQYISVHVAYIAEAIFTTQRQKLYTPINIYTDKTGSIRPVGSASWPELQGASVYECFCVHH